VAEEKESGLALQMVAVHLQKVESHKAARFGLLHLLRSIWKRKKNQSSQIHNKQAQKNIEMLRPTSSVLYFET